MSRIIPNEKTWVGFVTTLDDDVTLIPTDDEVAAAVKLSGFVISLNASSSGNVVPTPSFDTLFETSISGTTQASFTADFYRDNVSADDDAWTTLPRGTSGYFIVARFGGTGTGKPKLPIATDHVEVWPVVVTSRTMQNMSSNTVLSFTVTCSVPQEPNENATITVGP